MRHVTPLLLLVLAGAIHAQPDHHKGKSARVVEPTPIYAGGEYFPKPPVPSSYIRTRSASQDATKGVIRLSASCEGDEVLLGGGYQWGPSSGIAVVANYPSSETTWTNEFHVLYESGQVFGGVLPPFRSTLTTLAYCMSAPGVSIQMQTVVQDNAGQSVQPVAGQGALSAVEQSWASLCPDGSVLTGGGFAVDGPYDDNHDAQYNTDIVASQPLVGANEIATGWTVSLIAFQQNKVRATRAYARCALTGLKATVAGKIDANLTLLPTAIGNSVVVSQCPANGLTTGGGHAYTGDWLIPHWVSSTKVDDSNFNFQSWRAGTFGGYQTPRYEFRSCTPVTAQCLSATVIASCFSPPDIDYITVRITSPPSGYSFGLERYGGTSTVRIAFTAEVYDKNGQPITDAIVRWTSAPRYQFVPPPGSSMASTEEFLGFGRRLNTALSAGATFQDVIIKAYAVVPRTIVPQLKKKWRPLIASDQIVLTVGTVP